MELLKKNKYSFILSILLTLLLVITYVSVESIYNKDFNFSSSVVNNIPLFLLFPIISFFIIKWMINKYINQRVNTIFQEISSEFNNIEDKPIDSVLDDVSIELIKKLQDRTVEINTLKDQDTYRKEFLGNVSHELKTPLFTIQGYILTLLDGALKDKTVRDKYLKRAAKGVDRLINIVLDLDLITQFESGIKIVDKKRFDIVELIQNVFDLIEIESEKSNSKLSYDKDYSDPIYVFADEERILQVLTNLLVNSLKYGVNGGKTEVSIVTSKDHKILIKVSDDGIGVPSEHLPRLFERFYRVDATRSRKKGGSGLGLSIVKHIIEAHNENIYVESEFGKGTTFSFTLEQYQD